MEGTTYGRFTLIEFIGRNKRYQQIWLAQCSCGNQKIVMDYSLKSGNTQSCGCYHKEKTGDVSRTHGMARTSTYQIWFNMKRRCYNPSELSYARYGALGVRVCERWRESFENFLEDMGVRPSKLHSIDRINPYGDYEPTNCRWATSKEQGRNKKNTIRYTYKDFTGSLPDICDKFGVNYRTVRKRVRMLGWSIEEAVELPRRSVRHNNLPQRKRDNSLTEF